MLVSGISKQDLLARILLNHIVSSHASFFFQSQQKKSNPSFKRTRVKLSFVSIRLAAAPLNSGVRVPRPTPRPVERRVRQILGTDDEPKTDNLHEPADQQRRLLEAR